MPNPITSTAGAVLVDTSAWIEAFRGGDIRLKQAVDRLLDEERVVFCGVIELELYHGFRPHERDRILPLFDAMSYVEVDRDDWRRAGALLFELRSRGVTIPATDALIGSLCLRHSLSLLTLDRHFRSIPKLSLLTLTL